MIAAHARYLRYVIRHKWFVLVAGLRVGAPLWRLLVHDWSKFTPAEWGAYVRFFYGRAPACTCHYGGGLHLACEVQYLPRERGAAFDVAWLHHQKRNRHHWQYWVLMEDQPKARRFALQSFDTVSELHIAAVRYDDGRETVTGRAHIVNGGLCDPGEADVYQVVSAVVRDANRYVALPMPMDYVREMVADWMGAGRAITGRWEVREWYEKNRANMVLHPETRADVEWLLEHKVA